MGKLGDVLCDCFRGDVLKCDYKQLQAELDKAKILNEKLAVENAKLNLILFHRENGLAHPDLNVEIDKSKFAEVEAELERLKEGLEWKKQIPNKEGYWLRVNAVGRVAFHKVFNDFCSDDKLSIYWGWSPQSKSLIENIKDKLGAFYWCGPLPEPPEQALKGK